MSERHSVCVLPENVANQIAAGEVVERPASVVKELVENAIDAGATRIEVEIRGGGIKLITVRDNGCGMTHDDALCSLERQATSKISTVDDITRITTLGFRGEAIPSIASVSRFTLRTRIAESDAGTELHVVGGTLEADGAVGVPIGTSVEVQDLFFNVPARRKFLKAVTTETTRIRMVILITALAHPEIGFVFRSEGHEVYRLPEKDSLSLRIPALLGEGFSESLLPVDYDGGAVKVTGFVAVPTFARQGTTEQYIFVNGRPASAPCVHYALREAFPAQDEGKRPVAVLFIQVPPEDVDVNVHPAKREVRFRKQQEVVSALIAGISRAFASAGLLEPPPMAPEPHPVDIPIPQTPGATGVTPPVSNGTPPARSAFTPMPTPQAPTPRQLSFVVPAAPSAPQTPTAQAPTPQAAPISPSPITQPEASFEPPTASKLWAWCRVADILDDGFALLVTNAGFVMLDVRNATERVVYEQLIYAAPNTILSQQLLLPETIHLSPTDSERVRRYLEAFQEMGFGISDFSNDAFIVDALPVQLIEMPVRALLADLAERLEQTGVKAGTERWQVERVARAAAQASARQSAKHTRESLQVLVQTLAETRMPYASPRGKPTLILVSYRELARRFQRV